MRGDLDDVFLRGRLLDSMTQRELAAVPGLTQVAEMPDGSRQVSDERSGWSGVIPASPDQMRVVINPQQGSQQPPTLREGVGTGAPLLAPSGPTMDAAAPVPAAVPAEDVEAAAAAPTTPTRHAVPGRPDPLHDPESLWWAGEATRGVLHGVNNTVEAFLDATRLGQFADWLEEQIPLGRVEYKLPETAVGEIAAGGAQVVAGMVPAMRLVRGIARLKGVLGASANFIRWSRWTAGGAIADALGWDEDEPTVFNLLKEMEPYDNETVEEIRQAVQGALAKNESDTELVKRLKMAGEGAVLGSTIDLVVGLVRGTRAVIRSTRSGDSAGQPVVRAIDDATRQLEELQAQGVAPVRVEGQGVPFESAVTDNNLRLHRMRLGKGTPYPGGPKNQRRVLPAPAGSDLPDFVIGDITPEDWLARTEALMNPGEIREAAQWYEMVYGEFLSRTANDKEKAKRLMGAWLAAQQNESPANAMGNVLFMWEQLSRGVPIENVTGKGLPSANRAALAVLSGENIEGGVGQKIADFIDSAGNRDVRSIMGNDPVGGQPFVVDVHTARDTGLVDQVLVNHLRGLGYEVPDDIIIDLAGGGIKGTQYENRALFGRGLTDYLNGIGWQGRSDWKPREIQAIGWMGLTHMYGGAGVGGDAAVAFGRNLRRISIEAAPGDGSPAAIKYGDRFSALEAAVQNDITYKLTQKAIDKVNVRLGINLGDIVHSTGGWEKYTNPSTVQQAIVSRETAQAAANELGFLLQQTEVWVNTAKALTKNPRGFAIDLIENGSTTIKDNDDALADLWQMAMDADALDIIKGYQPIEDAAGNVGIRILIDKGGKRTRAAIDEWLQKFRAAAEELPYTLNPELSEAVIYKARNNWRETPDGTDYRLARDNEAGGRASAQDGSVLDSDRQELEDFFGTLIEQAEGGAK